jgi:energy-coupling factor transporter transmembrane protein EcfT
VQKPAKNSDNLACVVASFYRRFLLLSVYFYCTWWINTKVKLYIKRYLHLPIFSLCVLNFILPTNRWYFAKVAQNTQKATLHQFNDTVPHPRSSNSHPFLCILYKVKKKRNTSYQDHVCWANCDIVSVTNQSVIFLWNLAQGFYKKLYSRYQYCKKQLSAIHTLLRGIHKLLPVLSIFLDHNRKSPCNAFNQLWVS